MFDVIGNLGMGFGVVFQITNVDLGPFSLPIPMNVPASTSTCPKRQESQS